MYGQSHQTNVPEHRYSAGKDIVCRLLDKEENTRLGSKTGASEVKQHKWFSKINWGLLRNTAPPVSCAACVARFRMVACGFVYYLSPELWPCSPHMVLFKFCMQSLVDRRSGADKRLFRSSLHHQTEWTLSTFAEWRSLRRSISRSNRTRPTLPCKHQVRPTAWSPVRAGTCLVPFQALPCIMMGTASFGEESCAQPRRAILFKYDSCI
jgi:hypothetical protein